MTFDQFNLLNEFNILRIMCGLFFIPHIIGKFTEPKALELFGAFGFKPPRFWLLTACVIEIVLTVGLVFGIFTRYVAALAFIHLLVAAGSTYRLNHKWLWHIGGAEYCVFWALACLVVAIHG
jgi:putative oxidoreductase